jgi:serine/threonine protein kinase
VTPSFRRNECAVKIFAASKNDLDAQADFDQELEIMHQLRHPNILNFYGAVTKDTESMCIVSERCACSVYAQLQKYGSLAKKDGKAKLNLKTRVRYALDAAKGMVFLHARLIIHRDLKSSNLLIANDNSKTVCSLPTQRPRAREPDRGRGRGRGRARARACTSA